jgi:hypothetical protein
VLPRLKANAVVRVLAHGRTSPCVVLATDDEGETQEVVVKWRWGPEQRDIGGICELVCSLLADDLGLPTPKPSLIEVDEEFHRGIHDPRLAKIVEQSAGLNFGGAFLSGHNTWPRDKSLPLHLQQVGLETFAFDVLVDNPDRRQAKPNILWSGDELALCDHEQAFSFVRGVLFWKPAWAGGELKHFREHIFFNQLKRMAVNLNRFNGALEALSDERLAEYADAIPEVWKNGNDATDKILDYIGRARENRTALFAVINEMTK